jgi:hypothetical protein
MIASFLITIWTLAGAYTIYPGDLKEFMRQYFHTSCSFLSQGLRTIVLICDDTVHISCMLFN